MLDGVFCIKSDVPRILKKEGSKTFNSMTYGANTAVDGLLGFMGALIRTTSAFFEKRGQKTFNSIMHGLTSCSKGVFLQNCRDRRPRRSVW